MMVSLKISKFRDRHIWYIVILAGIIGVFTYTVEQFLFSKTLGEDEWHPVFMAIRNFMYLGVVALSAWRFGFKGGVGAGLAIGLIELQHVITEITTGEHRVQNLIEFAIFAPVGVLTSWLIGIRKRTEEVLHETEKKYRDLYDNAPVMYYSVSSDRRILLANRQTSNTLGYSNKELVGKSVFDLYTATPNGKEKAVALFHRFVSGEALENEELEMQTKEGQRLWVLLSVEPIKDNAGRVIASRSVARDITEHKRTEEEIVRFKTSSDIATYGLTMLNAEREITYTNKACADLHGYIREELIGQHCTVLVPEAQLEAVDKLFQEAERTGSFKDQEIIHIRKDGTTFPSLMSGVTVRDDTGKPLYTSIVFIDITKQKQMQAQAIFNDRLASIGQLVSGVAHEINNPMTSVLGFSELLLQRDLPDDIKVDVKIVHEEAKRTARIVQNLLTFARKQPEGKTPVDINEPIQRVLALRTYEQSVNNIRVDTRLAPDLPRIMGNASQLQQVFLNIIVNAEQAMLDAHKSGTLTITTERAGDYVKTHFTDDGPGISPENMSQLFTPFFTTKGIGKGTGLGLSISYGIVMEHGGKIYAESELGKGATFVVELPIAKSESA